MDQKSVGLFRRSIFEYLESLDSKESVINEYGKWNAFDLFEHWDLVRTTEGVEVFFTEAEIKILSDFDDTAHPLQEWVVKGTVKTEDFLETPQWESLNKAAKVALGRLKMLGSI